jgi:hypothetical protein
MYEKDSRISFYMTWTNLFQIFIFSIFLSVQGPQSIITRHLKFFLREVGWELGIEGKRHESSF